MIKYSILPILCCSASVYGATVIQDFNDAATGTLAGQTIGTGASAAWTGSSSIDVFAGDLIAPASTNYAITQGGTAQSLKHQGNYGTAARKANVALDTALTGSTIWGSFLINMNNHADGRVGIQFNTTNTTAGATPSNPRIFGIGTDLEAWMTSSSEIDLTGTVALTTTSLVLFRIDYQSAGDETFSLWIDPDVTNLGAADGTSTSDWLDAGGITDLSAFSYTSASADEATGGPIIDSIRLSDDADAYAQVTGVVPEPSSAALLGLGGLALILRRRK